MILIRLLYVYVDVYGEELRTKADKIILNSHVHFKPKIGLTLRKMK